MSDDLRDLLDLREQTHQFVDRCFENLGAAPKWWRRVLLDLAKSWISERPVNLIDAAEPWTEYQRLRVVSRQRVVA